MTFADPSLCLSCRGLIGEGAATCPHCGMNLGSQEIQQAWRALVVADQWVDRARALGAPDNAADAQQATPAAALAPTAPKQRRLSAGTVLLVLGAMASSVLTA